MPWGGSNEERALQIFILIYIHLKEKKGTVVVRPSVRPLLKLEQRMLGVTSYTK